MLVLIVTLLVPHVKVVVCYYKSQATTADTTTIINIMSYVVLFDYTLFFPLL